MSLTGEMGGGGVSVCIFVSTCDYVCVEEEEEERERERERERAHAKGIHMLPCVGFKYFNIM